MIDIIDIIISATFACAFSAIIIGFAAWGVRILIREMLDDIEAIKRRLKN